MSNKLPFPITFRELWEPDDIGSLPFPSRVNDGHSLTLTGASKQTTADGVHFTGGATSNVVVAANAAQNAKAAFNITIRFKLDQTFAAGAAGDFYLFNKLNAATYIRVYLKATDGKLYWEQDNGAGGAGFSLTSTTVSWTAGAWYIVTLSMTDTPTQRLIVNGSVEDTDISAAVVTPNGGDMVIGSSSDGGTDGIVGIISWVVIGVGATATVALTTSEEADLNRGIPPATAKIQYLYLFDEGRLSATLTNRGDAGVAAGTLDSACTWAYGQVRQSALSPDGINDTAISNAGLNISGNLTIAWVVKAKSTYSALGVSKCLWQVFISGSDYFTFNYDAAVLALVCLGNSVSKSITDGTAIAIDDYLIYICTINTDGTVKLYRQGTLVNTATGLGIVSGAAATAYLVTNSASGINDVSKVLHWSMAETVFTAAQAKAFSRWLRDRMNLPISI